MRNAPCESECVCDIPVAFETLQYPRVSDALSPSDLYFLEKPVWTVESDS